ncbi:unnamed protein product [Rotaria socialis]|uniref:Macro domain-containing protein n=1 Tax=Rotaria socialis TaxID=392032 RepID=A0A817X617_9BILA|nr:unnamed protein product [Rotaria socialis]
MTLTEGLALTQAILTRYILTLCMILGIIGSLFNLIVFRQKKFQSNSCSVYFMATSIFNLLVIICGITPEVLKYYINYDLASHSSTFCKTKSYLVHSLLMMSRSSVALACIDRFALCSRTVRIRSLNQRRIATSLVVIICIVWIIVPIHILVYVDIQMPRQHCSGSGIYLFIYSIYAVIVTGTPLIIMIIFSFFVIRSLRLTTTRIRLSRVNSNSNNKRQLRMQKRDIQLITILISEVIVYYLSTIWYPIYSIYMTITADIAKTTNRFAIEGFIRYLSLSFFIFLNSCSLFYVNLLASKAFRAECKRLVVRWWKLDQNIITTTGMSENTGQQFIRMQKFQTAQRLHFIIDLQKKILLFGMASKETRTKSSELSQPQSHRLDRQTSQGSNTNQLNLPWKDNFDLIKYLQQNQETLKQNYGYGQSKKLRCPQYYFINENKSILIILQGDITRTKVDAIVNAANEHMTGGGGVDGVIHRAAGSELYEACVAHKKVRDSVRLPTGHSRILLSYNMSSTTSYIINTAGPIYDRYRAQECASELTSCYKTALALANLYDLQSIGFTAISCGIFGYPSKNGADVALRTVDKEAGVVPVIVFVLWDDHIYDAWVDKAKELKFTLFDIINPMPESSSLPSNDQPKSPTTFNPKVIDASTEDEVAIASKDDIEADLKRLPSVPNDLPDTQPADSMELDDNGTKDNSLLHTQQSLNMKNASLEEKETTNDKPHDEQTKSNDDTNQPTGCKGVDKSNAEIENNENDSKKPELQN